MALLLADGFDCYANTTQWLESGWDRPTTAVVINTTEGRFGGGCIKSTTNAAAGVSAVVARGGTVIVGFSYKHDGLGGTADSLLTGRGTANEQMFRLEHNASGDLKAFDNPNVQVGSTATAALAANTWYWIEVKVVLGTDATTGSIEVRVNGTVVIGPVTGIDTFVDANTQLVGLYFGGGDGIHWIDDVVIMDGTGPSMNNFIGPTQIDTFSPNAAGGVTNWTPNTGTQKDAVDDPPNAADDDTTYISSTTAAQEARFEIGNLSVTPTTIHGVQVRTRSRKPDAGNRTYRGLINVSSTEALGPTRGASTQFAWMRNGVFYTNPATSAAWTATGFNSMQAGVEIVA